MTRLTEAVNIRIFLLSLLPLLMAFTTDGNSSSSSFQDLIEIILYSDYQ